MLHGVCAFTRGIRQARNHCRTVKPGITTESVTNQSSQESLQNRQARNHYRIVPKFHILMIRYCHTGDSKINFATNCWIVFRIACPLAQAIRNTTQVSEFDLKEFDLDDFYRSPSPCGAICGDLSEIAVVMRIQ
jgi:hypothetical protein